MLGAWLALDAEPVPDCLSSFPENALFITHGLTMRLFLTRWFHWNVAYFESLENPDFCELIELRLDHSTYTLDHVLRQWKIAHPRSEPPGPV